MPAGANQLTRGSYVSHEPMLDEHDRPEGVWMKTTGDLISIDGVKNGAALAGKIHPGDVLTSFTHNGSIGFTNETQQTVTYPDGKGHYQTEAFARQGTVVATDRAHSNSIVLDTGATERLPNVPGADAVVKGIRKDDEIVAYRDEKGHPVIYNQTQHTVSRMDAHGRYTTERQPEQQITGELAKVTRDPKDPDRATLELTDSTGSPTRVTIHDRPGKRIEDSMKIGDTIDVSYRGTNPGNSDLEVKDRTRGGITFGEDHNGARSTITHGPVRPQAVAGVTHQHGNGPMLKTAPGVPFGGTIDSVKNDHGVVTLQYKDVMDKPHTMIIDGNAPGANPSLGPAALAKLHPGENFQLSLNNNGGYELKNFNTRETVTPGRGEQFDVAHDKPQHAAGHGHGR